MHGTVKFYVIDQGYGFITGEDGKDYWFNKGCLPRHRRFDPVEGDAVEFETRVAGRGPIAHHINLDPDKHTIDQKDSTHAVHDLQTRRNGAG